MDARTEEGFYVTLPSNASLNVFTENTIASYRVDLAQHLHLEGPWQVALTEISYPHTWYNTPKDNSFFHWIDAWEHGAPEATEPVIELDEKRFTLHVKRFESGYYDDKEQIMKQINACMREISSDVTLLYHECKHKFQWLGSGRYRLRFFPPMAYMLGLKPGEWFTSGLLIQSPRTADIKAGFYHMFCYSDVVQHQAVGDAYAPLLRTVQIEGKFGDVISHTFSPAYYLPVAKRHIENISVELKTDQNRPVDFKFGKVVATLHFKPCKTVS